MRNYLSCTRSPWYSFLFVLPLLALYQLAVLLANAGERRGVINGADALIQRALDAVGLHGWLGTALVAAVVAGVLVRRADPEHRKGPVRLVYFWGVLGESALYAMVFGTITSTLTALLFPIPGLLQIGGGGLTFGQKLAAGLGAGLYEELVFRLLLTGGLFALLKAMRRPKREGRETGRTGRTPAARRSDWAALGAAILLSSLAFSLFHYVGSLGEPFRLESFLFRFVAGLLLAGLFAARGFAVAAWTHSLYDVFLLVARGG